MKRLAKGLKRFKEQTDDIEPAAAMISPSVLHEPEFVDRIIKAHKKKAELKQQKCSACGSYEILQTGSCVACTVCGESSGCG